MTDRTKPARTRAECAPDPSPADRAFGEHRARPLRRPVSGLAACQAAAFPPGGRAVASWAAWARARGSASRGRRTVAGTAQAGRRSASCFPFNCMHGMRMRAPNAAHTIAQRSPRANRRARRPAAHGGPPEPGPAARFALTLPAPPPTLARVLVLARAAPVRAVKRETGSLPAPQSSQPVLPPQR